MVELSCRDFTQILSEKKPVPGGGGAAALCAALGVALGGMMANYTIGNKKYAGVEEEMKEHLATLDGLRLRLLELVEEDALAFEPLSKAYSVSKDDPGRADLFETATQGAIVPPVQMVSTCAKVTRVLMQLKDSGNKMLLSDVGCAAALLSGAMKAASMNVYINTKCLLDRDSANAIEEELDGVLEQYIPILDGIVKEITEKIRS